MGHGYNCVVGYGCVVPIEDILAGFYDMTEYHDSLLNHENLREIRELFQTRGFNVYYEQHDELSNNDDIFITFIKKIIYWMPGVKVGVIMS